MYMESANACSPWSGRKVSSNIFSGSNGLYLSPESFDSGVSSFTVALVRLLLVRGFSSSIFSGSGETCFVFLRGRNLLPSVGASSSISPSGFFPALNSLDVYHCEMYNKRSRLFLNFIRRRNGLNSVLNSSTATSSLNGCSWRISLRVWFDVASFSMLWRSSTVVASGSYSSKVLSMFWIFSPSITSIFVRKSVIERSTWTKSLRIDTKSSLFSIDIPPFGCFSSGKSCSGVTIDFIDITEFVSEGVSGSGVSL
ncbi:hypothetical protein PGUG_04904 [Meyerozyma guilliermondii ATCC 6260]|uniref:Uncharacterized protein n=1 Tax=Meyerozyma guilliermondii (strain ATCC 6260 / CBS 566 / DSM 6381 / JCM 1539 / NBRC 10279 / NRRL Y-324) TaxID=294746 RepID=A5DNQ3_PICGU|nr:uncharacterized protein PGUG_04904 [Meyerozyma guilliermondii ATCC 6260]EDK40805.2 hypothetical protein PGUG_04904 [Meyerozyma guilliermondii ATCC 6260]